MNHDAVIAADFGGTKLAAAVVRGPRPVAIFTCATPRTAHDSLEAMFGLVDEAVTESGITTTMPIGVSFGGHLDGTRAVRSVHIPGWHDLDLAHAFTHRYGPRPIAVANDGTAGAVGEWARTRPVSGTLVYLTVSTGVGGGLVVDGSAMPGAHGLAGEFGHLRVPGCDRTCPCGRSGCLESIAAGPAIVTSYLAFGGTAADSAAEVADLAAAGDELAARALTESGTAVGTIIGALAIALDPDHIRVGGGVALAGPLWWDAVTMAASARTTWTVEVTAAPQDAPLLGAAELARAAVARRRASHPPGT